MWDFSSVYPVAGTIVAVVYLGRAATLYETMTVEALVRQQHPRLGYGTLPRWWRVAAALLFPLGLVSTRLDEWLWRMPPEDSPWR